MKEERTARRKPGRPLRRRVASRPELKTVVVFTEGTKSEPDYINALRRLPHIAGSVTLTIEIHPEHGVPLTLVKEAKERRPDSEIDEFWCLFDVEWPRNHPHLREALDMARSNGISVAVSNPCFEVWLILHHTEHGAWCETAEAESRSRAMDGRPGKGLDADRYMPLRHDAASRAERLDRRHNRNGTGFPDNNPSSGMHLFLRALEGSGDRPRPDQ